MAPEIYAICAAPVNPDDGDLLFQFEQACIHLGEIAGAGWTSASIRYQIAAMAVEQLADALGLCRSQAVFVGQCYEEHRRQGAALIETVRELERFARGELPS